MVTISPIRTEEDYQVALRRIDVLVDCADDSEQADELDILSILIENYENEHYPIAPPDPIDAIRFRMEQTGMSEAEIAVYLDGEQMAKEVLNRRKPLTLEMIKRLYAQLHIPAESLLAY
jgi:HTH-type transcriptional regulator / antitoxin HigA